MKTIFANNRSFDIPTLDDIHSAASRIRPYAHRTPVLTCQALNESIGHQIFLKCENFQKVGAFKFRGACNAVFSLTNDEARRGVVAHSSGNHAQALALAARMRGLSAYIVMPSNAPQVKKDAVASYGGLITFCEPTLEAREYNQQKIVTETGARIIHPYDDECVIAGQGTAALELILEVPDLDIVMTPVGGGGLLGGTAIAVRESCKHTRVVAAEPAMADDAARSLLAGKIIPSVSPMTIADGLLTSLGERNFEIIRTCVDTILTVSEASIISAMRFVWERAKIIIEPSAAVPIATLMDGQMKGRGLRIGVIVSGGNVDLNHLPWAT
jgi:threonine dehydratase